ncbi:MAG: PilT/PilU family type 4a pilus ATPase [Planctomycetaceae bacterium]
MTNVVPADDRQSDSAAPLRDWLNAALLEGASDLHVVAGGCPLVRVHGELKQLDTVIVSDVAFRESLTSLIAADQYAQFLEQGNLDASLQFEIDGGKRRFRVNLFLSTCGAGGCFRVIPDQIPDFEWAGFPRDLAERLATFRNGLVLFSGVTGAGKTTSLAMVIELMNQSGGTRIITVEEPVEYLFSRSENSLVTQREVGADVDSFANGLKYGLRQDPDVILVGEIRDYETAQMAISAAETGHLVFSTLHTRDAKGAITRLIDLFPQAAQSNVRSQLSMSLRAIVSQHLVPGNRSDRKRELALEVMFNNTRMAAAIRMGKLATIDNTILTGRSEGMINLDASLRRLLLEQRISRETALKYCSPTAELD